MTCVEPHSYATSACTGCAPAPTQFEAFLIGFESGWDVGFNATLEGIGWVMEGVYGRWPAAIWSALSRCARR